MPLTHDRDPFPDDEAVVTKPVQQGLDQQRLHTKGGLRSVPHPSHHGLGKLKAHLPRLRHDRALGKTGQSGRGGGREAGAAAGSDRPAAYWEVARDAEPLTP